MKSSNARDLGSPPKVHPPVEKADSLEGARLNRLRKNSTLHLILGGAALSQLAEKRRN
jgi:hypothetical protein